MSKECSEKRSINTWNPEQPVTIDRAFPMNTILQRLCSDIRIKIEDWEFYCSKAFLVSRCKFFLSMFVEFYESKQDFIYIKDIKPKYFC